MAMVRSDAVQDDLMATWAEMPRSPGHAFYDRLQDLLREAGFDAFVEGVCKPYYAPRMGAPSLPPGRYFRMHTIGYFEGIDSERGIAWPGRERQGLSASQGWPRPAPVNNRRHLHPPGGGASPASLSSSASSALRATPSTVRRPSSRETPATSLSTARRAFLA